MYRDDVAAVVIGRDEAPRLAHCLASITGLRSVYVDSGSSDGSADIARAAGVETIALSPEGGYSAARARNAGLARIGEDPAIAYVQMIDGDCTMAPGWIDAAAAALDADPDVAAIFGRLREEHPEASVYNWLCDVEWAVPAGEAAAFGGIVMLRAAALRDAGGYAGDMIAGEEPDLAIRLRERGWRILGLRAEMARHDAAITGFGQWWRRIARGGHAFAELAHRHPRSALHDYRRSCRRILLWGGAVPLLFLGGGLSGQRWLSWAMLLLVAAQIGRVTLRELRHHRLPRAFALALFLMIGKYAEMTGLIRYHLGRRGR